MVSPEVEYLKLFIDCGLCSDVKFGCSPFLYLLNYNLLYNTCDPIVCSHGVCLLTSRYKDS